MPRVFRVLGVVVIAGISRRVLIAIAVAVIETHCTAAAGYRRVVVMDQRYEYPPLLLLLELLPISLPPLLFP